MILRVFNTLIFSLAIISLYSCGGGSDDDNSSSDSSIGSDTARACSVVGLPTKIINGDQCGSLNSSAIVRVAAVIEREDDLLAIPTCTGTMISSDDVATAAHCFLGSDIQGFPIVGHGILFGEVGDLTFIAARETVTHPGLSSGSERLFNDLEIMKLVRSPGLSVMPILLSSTPSVGDSGFVYGYGVQEEGNADTSDTFVSLEAGAMRIENITPNHIFVVFNGSGVNVCNGDSGGPMIIDTLTGPAMIGIVSQGSVNGCRAGDVTTFINLQEDGTTNFISRQVPDVAVR